jgi:hypothetical protein
VAEVLSAAFLITVAAKPFVFDVLLNGSDLMVDMQSSGYWVLWHVFIIKSSSLATRENWWSSRYVSDEKNSGRKEEAGTIGNLREIKSLLQQCVINSQWDFFAWWSK